MQNLTTGQLITFYREKEGLTRKELAQIIDVSVIKLEHWENDETVPRPYMVGRLIGALGIPDDEIPDLNKAVETSKEIHKQMQAELQKIQATEKREFERIEHKNKTIRLLIMGCVGFIAGVLFFLVTGSYQDFPWYGPIVFGLSLAGIPYGWDLLTDKSAKAEKDPYYPIGSDSFLIDLVIKLFVLFFKFIASCLIAIFIYPIALFYHAYKAGRKGSVYKIIMLVLLIILVIVLGLLFALTILK